MNRLFVYGSLMPGKSNTHLLENIGGTWKKGHIQGRYYDQGWRAGQGYPGVKLDADGDRIHGYIFSSDHLQEHIAKLDSFEGADYARVIVKVTLEDGSIEEAYMYALSEA